MDVVWLKRDVRCHDHAPLATAFQSDRKLLILFVYEPDQLAHHTVHGSHVLFCNEGLADLEARLKKYQVDYPIVFRYGEVTQTLQQIYSQHRFDRLLAHEETGHLASFERDKRVRKWCKQNGVTFVEYQQLGVKRGLKDRNKFSYHYNKFINHALYDVPLPSSVSLRDRLVCDVSSCGILPLSRLPCIASEHAVDRKERQKGGETAALAMFESFLRTRGEGYARGVSSPNTAWSSCSRLSPYLAWGHISVRHVVQKTSEKQRVVRAAAKDKNAKKDEWAKSLAAFQSRLRWRAHFIQKLESQADLEIHAQCIPLDNVRRGSGDWNEGYFQAWKEGKTGYPMIDGCMRCLLQHGWVNFRMRAMLVSFACYNLWLDWRGVAGHLARCFLDFEPGIHYAQLQMQAGVTGINTMRVYSAVKQGKDHDGMGKFVRRYVPELMDVEDGYVQEPWKTKKKVGYVERVVEEKKSGSEAKRRMQSVRMKKESREAAKKVWEKLGSRMSGRKRQAEKGQDGAMEVEKGTVVRGKKQQKISEWARKKSDDVN